MEGSLGIVREVGKAKKGARWNGVAVLIHQVFAKEERDDDVQRGSNQKHKGQVCIQVLHKMTISIKQRQEDQRGHTVARMCKGTVDRTLMVGKEEESKKSRQEERKGVSDPAVLGYFRKGFYTSKHPRDICWTAWSHDAKNL